MSDGPYKTLPMRKAWKDVAERAHKGAYTDEETAEAMRIALHNDFQRDVGKEFFEAIGKLLIEQQQQNLLAAEAGFEIEAIRERFPSTSLGDAVIEHTQVALQRGLSGEAALEEGVNRAARDHAQACIRSVEEHYKRDAKSIREQAKTESVRDNLTKTLTSDAVADFGAEVVSVIRGEPVSTKLEKAVDLDAGPVLD